MLFDTVRAWEGAKWPYFYFLFMIVFGVYTLVNIFIIIILDNFSERYDEANSDVDLTAFQAHQR